MKTSLKRGAVIAAIISLIATIGICQPRHNAGNGANVRGKFMKLQIDVIQREINLEEKDVEPFRELYEEYLEELNAIRQPPKRNEGGAPRPPKSDEETETFLLDSFVKSQKSLDLKKNYYHKFKEILSPRQIARMYQVEKMTQERFRGEAEQRSKHHQAPRPMPQLFE